MNVEPEPFDPSTFDAKDDEVEQLVSEKTIRWRYQRDEKGRLIVCTFFLFSLAPLVIHINSF